MVYNFNTLYDVGADPRNNIRNFKVVFLCYIQNLNFFL
ncbi:ASFV G ACD 00270 [African swine fever virus]|uniref:ASFV G ACD 00270 CDS protein n=1 Tax=African swine fever virus TaxID=10497 RepID=A0A2X0RVJ0_ASF|nr:hypothetical protein IM014_gp033 [African swine fever virus]AYW33982.1 ASFV_G_ACD_00270 [African swine fever virus]AZP54137.1 ASFV-G-ACD-00270 [African swine fever virus]AZP54314.1 ASFV-G-ACD-00270 [African swine fever virus]QBH90492.1 ASFV_G_ACD_00270 [African swine fever virus]QBH90677.1 ASFV_G_ACD_00270 [African swine fever virus]